MRKLLLSAAITLTMTILQGADYETLCQDAAKAVRAKDYAEAEAKYDEAMRAAGNSVQKCDAILGKFQALRSQKKMKAAEDFMTGAIEDEMLLQPEIRQLLNAFAYSYLWTNRFEFGLSLVQQARNLQCPKSSNVYCQTYFCMAHIYLRKKQPQAAIEALKNVLDEKELHPANLYSGNMIAAAAYERLGKKEEALKHYRLALENGKKVKYKFDFSRAEKAIERLSK